MFGEKNNIGLDLGSYSMKAVKLSGSPGSYTLEGAASVKLPWAGGGRASGLPSLIRDFLKSQGIKGKTAATALAGPALIYRHLSVPPMPDKDLAEAVRWEIRKETAIPAGELVCDYLVSGEQTGGGQNALSVIAFASRRADIDGVMETFRETGLDLKAIGVVPTALHAVFDENNDCERGINYAMVEIGETGSTLVIFRERKLAFTREITFGGSDITRSIAGALQTGVEEAEEYKMVHGMDIPEADAGRVRDVLNSLIERLCSEIHRSIDYYQAQFRGGPVGLIYLSGGSALLKGMDEFISETMGLACFVHDPFRRVKVPKSIDAAQLKAEAASLNVAAGLAMRTIR